MPTVPSVADTLKPSQVIVALRALINANQPVILWGEPGIGKSQIVGQTLASLGLSMLDIRASLLDAVDLRGLPHVNGDGRSHWAVPEFLPRDGAGGLFLDELNRGTPMVQNGLFQLVLDRQLGEYRLPDEWRIVAACNHETNGGGIQRLNSALANRFVHLNVAPDVNDWCAWALTAGIDPLLVAFVRFRPALLHAFDAHAHAFPTPRAWASVSKIIAQHAPADIEFALVAGTVGHAAAVEYTAFARVYKNLPSIDAILLNPTQAAVPDDVATLYAVTSALAHRADDQNFGRVLQYIARLPGEYETFGVKDAVTRAPSLSSTPTFTQWAVAHANSL